MDINKWLRDHPRNCKYGAPMGMPDWDGKRDGEYVFYLQKIKMSGCGAYAPDGTYWGGCKDRPLYCAWDAETVEEPVRLFIRAKSRHDAKVALLNVYPLARFKK